MSSEQRALTRVSIVKNNNILDSSMGGFVSATVPYHLERNVV